MCNLDTARKSTAEVAAHFGVAKPVQSNASEEVYPAAAGIVIREEERARVMQSMAWGFPLRLKGISSSPSSSRSPIADLALCGRPRGAGYKREETLGSQEEILRYPSAASVWSGRPQWLN